MNFIYWAVSKVINKSRIGYFIYEDLNWIASIGQQKGFLEDITSFNMGYAWITKTGDVPKSMLEIPDEQNVR